MRTGNRWVLGIAIAVIVYAAMWIGFILRWGWLDYLDTLSLKRFHDFGVGRPGWVAFWETVSVVLGPTATRLVGLVMVVMALIRRHFRIALFLVISVGLMAVVTEVAKTLADRPRPTTELVYAPYTSFPSGHAVGITVGVLAFLTVLWPLVARPWRIGSAVFGVTIIGLVGVARVALNVHHPSDVVAGWALGFLFYSLCLRVAPPYRVTSAPQQVRLHV